MRCLRDRKIGIIDIGNETEYEVDARKLGKYV